MIRAVLDTNVVVSALIAKRPSPPLAIYQAFIHQHFLLVTSAGILEEAEEVLNREHLVKVHGWTPRQVSRQINTIATMAMVVPDIPLPEPICQDPDDDEFIACAIAGQADYLVSGDKHLLTLKQHEGIQIITPQEFVTARLER